MRKLLLAGLVLVACAKTDDTAVDTTAAAAVEPALTPAQSMYAGTWNGRAHRADASAADTGSTWTMTLTPADAGMSGTIRFSGQTTDIPVRVESMTEAGMRSTFGPYISPAAGNIEVTTTTDGRIDGDSLVGTFVATPTAGGAATNGRFVARKQ